MAEGERGDRGSRPVVGDRKESKRDQRLVDAENHFLGGGGAAQEDGATFPLVQWSALPLGGLHPSLWS
jgi:hypothetical protein